MGCDGLLKSIVILEQPIRTCFGKWCMRCDCLLNDMVIMEGP